MSAWCEEFVPNHSKLPLVNMLDTILHFANSSYVGAVRLYFLPMSCQKCLGVAAMRNAYVYHSCDGHCSAKLLPPTLAILTLCELVKAKTQNHQSPSYRHLLDCQERHPSASSQSSSTSPNTSPACPRRTASPTWQKILPSSSSSASMGQSASSLLPAPASKERGHVRGQRRPGRSPCSCTGA